LVNDSQADLVKNLKNLEPTIRALADVGPELGTAVAAGFVFPFTQNFVDRAVRGDYFNLHVDLDVSIPRLKRGLMLGTHWGQLDQPLVPAPGDPYYLQYTHDPMHDPIRPPWVDPARLPLPPLPGPPPGTASLPNAGLAQTPPPATAPAEGGG
jgi:phospholipid/cholesterol/gamma-HCH transport system substrate-binding protein